MTIYNQKFKMQNSKHVLESHRGCKINKKSGFTIAELLVVITIFTTITLISSSVYSRYSTAERKVKQENELLEETRFTMEKIVKEFREGTLDYEEYWNQANNGDDCILYSSGGTIIHEESYGTYGNCYKDYTAQFYDTPTIYTSNKLNTGQNPSDADETTIFQTDINAVSTTGSDDYQQDELYIINNSGNKKTLLRLTQISKPLPTDALNTEGRLQILRLNGFDLGYEDDNTSALIKASFNDGIIDSWKCSKDFTCNTILSDGTSTAPTILDNNDGWIDYSPSTLNITNLEFYIAPLEDPKKAYNEDSPEIQIQPHATIMITAQMSSDKFKGLPGENPNITLQTTVSARVFNEVK